MDIAGAVRAARRTAGLTQAEVAERAGTSQAAVASYEGGRKSPSLPTLVRLATAMDATLSVRFTTPTDAEHAERPAESLSREERRSLWLHRAVAARIQEDPEGALALGRASLDKKRHRDSRGSAEAWWNAWDGLLDGPLESLLTALCSTSTYASQLRQTAPFPGLLTPRQRWAVYRSFTKGEDESRGV